MTGWGCLGFHLSNNNGADPRFSEAGSHFNPKPRMLRGGIGEPSSLVPPAACPAQQHRQEALAVGIGKPETAGDVTSLL